MNIYQKAIKVRKVCKNRESYRGENQCTYFKHCNVTELLINLPLDYNLIDIARAIQIEKWKVK